MRDVIVMMAIHSFHVMGKPIGKSFLVFYLLTHEPGALTGLKLPFIHTSLACKSTLGQNATIRNRTQSLNNRLGGYKNMF